MKKSSEFSAASLLQEIELFNEFVAIQTDISMRSNLFTSYSLLARQIRRIEFGIFVWEHDSNSAPYDAMRCDTIRNTHL